MAIYVYIQSNYHDTHISFLHFNLGLIWSQYLVTAKMKTHQTEINCHVIYRAFTDMTA